MDNQLTDAEILQRAIEDPIGLLCGALGFEPPSGSLRQRTYRRRDRVPLRPDVQHLVRLFSADGRSLALPGPAILRRLLVRELLDDATLFAARPLLNLQGFDYVADDATVVVTSPTGRNLHWSISLAEQALATECWRPDGMSTTGIPWPASLPAALDALRWDLIIGLWSFVDLHRDYLRRKRWKLG